MTEHAAQRLRSSSLGGGPRMPKEAKPSKAEPIDVTKARQQQHTGNHDKPGPERGGSDRHGGTRHGAENVEPLLRPSSVRKPNKEGDPHSCAARSRHKALSASSILLESSG